MKRVLIITYYWPPSGGSGVQRWLKFVKYFEKFEIEPVILTVDPEKASYAVTDHSLLHDVPENVTTHQTDTFEPYNIYKKISKKKEIPHSGFANEANPGFMQKLSRFIRGNVFIPDSRKGWNRYAMKKAIQIINTTPIDAIITTSPPHSTQLIGLKLKQLYNIPWIADLRDPWTDIYYYKQLYHTSWAAKADKKMERLVLENSDQTIVVSQAIKNIFIKKSQLVDADKIHIIPNGFDTEDFSEQIVNTKQDEFLITYTGTLSDEYDASAFINAFYSLTAKGLNIKLRLVGKISENFIKQLPSDKIEIKGYVDHDKSIGYMMESDALLLIIPKIKDNEGILTGKLFEYIGSKKHIISIGPSKSDAKTIIDQCKAGKMFDYTNSNDLEAYIDLLIEQKKQGSLCGISEEERIKYSRENLTHQLSLLL